MEVTRKYLVTAVLYTERISGLRYESKDYIRNVEVSITHEDSDTIGSIVLKARNKIGNCNAILNIWEL